MTILKLTHDLFLELDFLVRTEAGCALSVFHWMEKKGRFGYFSWQPEGCYLNSEITEGAGCCCERLLIKIANQIETDRFAKGFRLEMDWGAIPKNLIYKFIVFHEMGHRLFDSNEWNLDISPSDRTTLHLFYVCNEVRADRYGWKRLFAKEAFPVRSDRRNSLEEITEFMDSHKEWFLKEPRKVIQISTDPKEIIPIAHIKGRIPWA